MGRPGGKERVTCCFSNRKTFLCPPLQFHHNPEDLIDLFLFTNVASCFFFTDMTRKFGLQKVTSARKTPQQLEKTPHHLLNKRPASRLDASSLHLPLQVVTGAAGMMTLGCLFRSGALTDLSLPDYYSEIIGTRLPPEPITGTRPLTPAPPQEPSS